MTVDWLLSEDAPENDAPEPMDHTPQPPTLEKVTWADSFLETIKKLILRYGWLYGVYMAIGGLGITLIGILARVMTKRMFSSTPFDAFGAEGSFQFFATNNPVYTLGTVILGIGIVIILAGIILAIYLRKRGNRNRK